jgi:hypothetical protein
MTQMVCLEKRFMDFILRHTPNKFIFELIFEH